MRLSNKVAPIHSVDSLDLFEVARIVGVALLAGVFYRIPFFVQEVPNGDMVINVLTAVASTLITILVAPDVVKDRRAAIFFGLLLLFELSVMPFSLIEGGSAREAVKYYATVLLQMSYCLLIYKCIKSTKGDWVTSLELIAWCIVLVNFYTLIAYPDGLYHVGESANESSYRNWFLGYDNAHAEYFIYAVMFAMLGSYKRTGRQVTLSSLVMYALCLISTLIVQASTSTVALAVLGIYMLIRGRSEKAGPFNIRSYLIAYFVVLVFLVSIALGHAAMPDAITQYVSGTFGKDATFSNRTILWSNAFSWFGQSPLFGNGVESADVLVTKIGHASGAHNEFINILYAGGLIHFVLFCALLVISMKPLWKNKDLIPARIISISIFCMLLLQLMRGCSEVYWLSMYLMAYFVLDIDQDLNNRNLLKKRKYAR